MTKKEVNKDLNVKLMEGGCAPVRANPTDAGADLITPINFTINPGATFKLNLGVCIELPHSTVGYIFARSSLGTKFGVTPRNCVGVIDEKYRGELIVVLENKSKAQFAAKAGDRIAQLVVMPVLTPKIKVVQNLNMDGDRGGGFGHTGK